MSLTNNKVSIAILGAGRIGNVHANAALQHPDIRVKYIADPYLKGAQELASKVGAAVCDTETVMDDSDVQGVVIASATSTHADLLLQAAKKGKVIFCEKPISLDIDVVTQCVDYINQSGAKCMLGFQRRYDRSFRQVRERIFSGDLGNVEQVTIISRDPSPPPIDYIKHSGGIFRDMAIHDFDMARYLIDEPITTVYATGSCLVDQAIAGAGDVDTLTVTMMTENGKTIQIANTRRGPLGYEQRLEVLCSKGILKVDNLPQHSVTEANGTGLMTAPPENFFLERYAQAYHDEMDMFAQMMLHNVDPLANHIDGYEAQRLAEAAIHSFNSGNPVNVEPVLL